jgi:YHS domain-containing protein
MANVKDLVCGMTVNTDNAISAEHNGKTYYFCGEGCRAAFVADPTKFVDGGAA